MDTSIQLDEISVNIAPSKVGKANHEFNSETSSVEFSSSTKKNPIKEIKSPMALSGISEELERPKNYRDQRPRRVKQLKIGQYVESPEVKKSIKRTKKNATNNRDKKVIAVNGDENEDVGDNLWPAVKATSKNGRLKKEKASKLVVKNLTLSNQRQNKIAQSKAENDDDTTLVLKPDRKRVKKNSTKVYPGALKNGEENGKDGPKIEIKEVKKMVSKECKPCVVKLKQCNALLEQRYVPKQIEGICRKELSSKEEMDINESQASVVETFVKSRGRKRVRRAVSADKETIPKENETNIERKKRSPLKRQKHVPFFSDKVKASSSDEIKEVEEAEKSVVAKKRERANVKINICDVIIKQENSSPNELAVFGADTNDVVISMPPKLCIQKVVE